MIDAAQLYADNCVACHGADGSGAAYGDIRGKNADDMRNTDNPIMQGQLSNFSEAEIDALGEYISQWEATTPLAGDPAAGKTLYEASTMCLACHQSDRSGGVGGAKALTTVALQSSSTANGDFDTVVASILRMATTYNVDLNEDQAKDMAAYFLND